MKKIMIVLSLIFVIAFCGCTPPAEGNNQVTSQENGGSESVDETMAEYGYTVEQVPLTADLERIDKILFEKDHRIIFGYDGGYLESGERTMIHYMESFELDGSLGEKTEISGFPSGYFVTEAVSCADGYFLLLLGDSSVDTLLKIDFTGNIVLKKDMKEETGSEDCYMDSLAVDSAGIIYMTDSSTGLMYSYSTAGEMIARLENAPPILKSGDGTVYGVISKENAVELYPLKDTLEQTEKTGEMKIKGISNCFLGDGDDFLLCTQQEIGFYNMKTEAYSQVGQYATYGINKIMLKDGYAFDDRNVVLLMEGDSAFSYQLVILRRTLEKTVADTLDDINASTVTIATLSPSEELQYLVSRYNGGNHPYTIEIHSYYDDLMGEGTAEDALTRLNADLINGTAGDIIDLVSLETVSKRQSYISKGVLESLDSYLENDNEIDLNQYFENILTSHKIDGHLYEIPLFYEVPAVCIRSSVYDKMGKTWTIDSVAEIVKKENFNLWGNMKKIDFLKWFAESELNTWLASGMEEDDFLSKVLALSYSMNEDEQDADWDQAYENRLLMYGDKLQSTGDTYVYAKTLFQESPVILSFPDMGTGDIGVKDKISLGISATSKKKNESWNILKVLMSEELQENLDAHNDISLLVPLNRTVFGEGYLEKMNERFQNTGIGSRKMEWFLLVPGEEDVEKYIQYIESVNTVLEVDSKLEDILVEEADGYYSGEYSLDETVGRMKDRLMLYYNEQK